MVWPRRTAATATAAMALLRRPPRPAAAAAAAASSASASATAQPSLTLLPQASRRSLISKAHIARLTGDYLKKQKIKNEPSLSEMRKDGVSNLFEAGESILFQGTFIPLPLSKIPFADLLRYQWWRLKYWFASLMQLIQLKLQSMPRWRSRPRLRVHRHRIASTARTMHHSMLHALARGDKPALEQLCTPSYAAELSAVIHRRSLNRSSSSSSSSAPADEIRLQPIRDTRRPFYPRLVSHRIHAVNPYDASLMTEQAVVALSSRQQLARHLCATGAIVPGSLRSQDKIEYLVLVRQFRQNVWVTSPWRIWGTTRATTPREYRREVAAVQKELLDNSGVKNMKKTPNTAK